MSEKKIDKISLETALEFPMWKMVWAGEPDRKIDVRMTYTELKAICDFIVTMRDENERN